MRKREVRKQEVRATGDGPMGDGAMGDGAMGGGAMGGRATGDGAMGGGVHFHYYISISIPLIIEIKIQEFFNTNTCSGKRMSYTNWGGGVLLLTIS